MFVRPGRGVPPLCLFLRFLPSFFTCFFFFFFFFKLILHVFPHPNWEFKGRGCCSLYRLLNPLRQCDYISTNEFSRYLVRGCNVVADGCIIPPACSWFSTGPLTFEYTRTPPQEQIWGLSRTTSTGCSQHNKAVLLKLSLRVSPDTQGRTLILAACINNLVLLVDTWRSWPAVMDGT